METNHFHFINIKTNEEVHDDNKLSRFINTLPLSVVYDYEYIKKYFSQPSFIKLPIKALKYKQLYPIKQSTKFISLQEGGTPLYLSFNLRKKLGLMNLYFKYEGMNPTGAFKDRGSVVEITSAIEHNAKGVIVASTGNMAASVSAYCARASIPCFVFIPEGTPQTKLAQTLFYGGNIIKIKGTYDQAAVLAQKIAEEFNFYLAGDYVFRTEGQKSQAYEIIEQLNFQVPDYIIVPTGNGTNIFAIWKGFQEYFEMNLIDKLPHMVAVQINSHKPIVTAFEKDLSEITFVKPSISNPKATIASAIAVNNPLDGNKVLNLLKKSKGIAIAVADEEILKAQMKLASCESLFVEPSSASVIAALTKLMSRDKISKDATVVCLLSGCGFKDPFSATPYFPEGFTVEPEFLAIKKIFQKKQWIK